MKKSVKARMVLLFITGILSIISALGVLVTVIFLMEGTFGTIYLVKGLMVANIFLGALSLLQANSLLNV